MLINTAAEAGNVMTVALDCRAPRRKVYETWTEPAWLKKWFRADEGYTCTVAEVDLRVGGAFALAMALPGKDETRFSGVYQVVRPAEALVYTWEGGEGNHVTLVTAVFSDRDKGSRIDFTHGVFSSQKSKEEHAMGWRLCFRQLALLLGEEDPGDPRAP
jgi:uncharacterized protein YndB with AHSA1/START domain